MPRGKGLADEPLEYRLEQYGDKNSILEEFGEPVSAWTMYEDIFGDMEQLMPIVIIDEDEQKHLVKMSIEEAVETARGRNDVLMGGCTYFKEFVSKQTAKDIYAFIIDMDNVYSGILLRAFQRDWATANGQPLPMPTYIVNSGIGLHLYFVLDEPLPHFKRNAEDIDRLYRELAEQQTTKRNYLRRQVQWFGQDFRMAGGCGKDMWLNTAFRVGKKWGADELAAACGLNIHFSKCGEVWKPSGKAKKGKAYRKRQGWYTNRAFYDSALRQCREKSVEGWRYTSMCALSVIAWKCNVPYEEVERDLYSLLPDFNRDARQKVKEREVVSALKMYGEKAMLTQRQRLEDWQGWKYSPIKRNGRKQAQHLEIARGVRELKGKIGEVVSGGGRPLAQDRVYEWRQQHPEGRKVDCHRDTGLDPKTIRKWWDCPPAAGRIQDGHITVRVAPSQAVSDMLVEALEPGID